MSAVDVLAVLGALEDQTLRNGGSPSFHTISEARAAVAELMGTAHAILSHNSEHYDTTEEAELRAALRNCGAKP